MGKRYGEPYDPAMRETEHGSRLYQAWKRMRKHPHIEEWDNFPSFYVWSIGNGYTIGARLYRVDASVPYGPDNCSWYIKDHEDDFEPIPESWADSWNKTVNRIRKHYGLPPLGGDDHG